jgi:Outer membrane protein transport protein (OMPP1/FadL/TodX)
VNFESRFYTEGSYVPPRTDGATFFPATSEFQLKAVNWGVALGYKVSEVFSIGVSGGPSTLTMQSTLNRYTIAVFDDRFRANLASIDDSQVDFFANVGVLVKPTEKLSFGATYKRRPSFDLKHTFTFGPDSVRINTIHFNIPSAIGFGVSYRPTDVLTLAFDVDRVQYSSLTKDLVVTIAPEDQTAADFTVDDGMEYHFGAEYVWLLKSFGLVFRGGAFIEPDHRIRWVGVVNDRNLSPGDTRLLSRQASAALFQGGDADVHYTFGFGVIMSNNFQLDFAGDIADPAKEVVGSLVVRL